ncbi:hypothetical protein C7401_14818 [Paraburkholderia unamae]|uniref:hypothetical protein n=1 Tax=Paraburkholderia unamae TaxID=219649 RepID=UPI000DC32F25|nr:hypothetical protein [Paraburkholderia unamae]RAR48835.1 hypothetical protein C7401_14818 [Paraburkholderia unamae]
MLQTMFPPDGLAAQAQAARRNLAGTPVFAALVTHPGRAQAPRVLDATTGNRTREFNVILPGGTRVGAALRGLLDGWGAGAGCGRIVAGACARVQYHVMTHATEGPRPYVYGPPIVTSGENTLIGAAITIGRREDGVRILHCHGGFVDAQGRHHGGHVILDETFAAATGLHIRLCLFDGIDLVVSPDAETTFDLLQPV